MTPGCLACAPTWSGGGWGMGGGEAGQKASWFQIREAGK